MAAGDAKGRVFTFPIPTYNITRILLGSGIWRASGNDGEIWRPVFLHFINSDMNPEDAGACAAAGVSIIGSGESEAVVFSAPTP